VLGNVDLTPCEFCKVKGWKRRVEAQNYHVGNLQHMYFDSTPNKFGVWTTHMHVVFKPQLPYVFDVSHYSPSILESMIDNVFEGIVWKSSNNYF
jgi:hypothetical protein